MEPFGHYVRTTTLEPIDDPVYRLVATINFGENSGFECYVSRPVPRENDFVVVLTSNNRPNSKLVLTDGDITSRLIAYHSIPDDFEMATPDEVLLYGRWLGSMHATYVPSLRETSIIYNPRGLKKAMFYRTDHGKIRPFDLYRGQLPVRERENLDNPVASISRYIRNISSRHRDRPKPILGHERIADRILRAASKAVRIE